MGELENWGMFQEDGIAVPGAKKEQTNKIIRSKNEETIPLEA